MSVERETKEDYFNRLELKFLELQAKQSFLHRITGDECPSVEPGENERLGEWDKGGVKEALSGLMICTEQHNDRKVAAIKALMAEDAAMSAKVLALSKQNAAGELSKLSPLKLITNTIEDHAQLASQTAEMARLLAETRSMELELARLKTVYPPEDVCVQPLQPPTTAVHDFCADISQRMTIDQAFDRIDKQEAEIQRLTSEGMVMDAQTEALRATNAVQAKRVLALARDRETAEAKAAAARRAREAGSEGTKVRDLMEWCVCSFTRDCNRSNRVE
jgi:hypothetical protein